MGVEHSHTNRVAFYTLGCKLNFSETSTLARSLENEGYQKVAFEEVADVYVINTCSVTENADKKFRSIAKSAHQLNPEAYIVAVGCYAQLKPEELAAVDGVDNGARAKESVRPWQAGLAGTCGAVDGPHLALSHADFAASGGELPSFADLLGLCARGVDASWALAWRVVYAKTYLALPSLGRTGIRSGSRAGRRPPSGSRAAAIGKGICDNWCAGARRDPTNESGKP